MYLSELKVKDCEVTNVIPDTQTGKVVYLQIKHPVFAGKTYRFKRVELNGDKIQWIHKLSVNKDYGFVIKGDISQKFKSRNKVGKR